MYIYVYTREEVSDHPLLHNTTNLERSCATVQGWLLRGEYLDSGLGHADDVRLSFKIITKGFAGEGGLVSRTASRLGMVRIDFELDCDGPCYFSMYEVNYVLVYSQIASIYTDFILNNFSSSYYNDLHNLIEINVYSMLRRQSRDTNRNIKRLLYCQYG